MVDLNSEPFANMLHRLFVDREIRTGVLTSKAKRLRIPIKMRFLNPAEDPNLIRVLVDSPRYKGQTLSYRGKIDTNLEKLHNYPVLLSHDVVSPDHFKSRRGTLSLPHLWMRLTFDGRYLLGITPAGDRMIISVDGSPIPEDFIGTRLAEGELSEHAALAKTLPVVEQLVIEMAGIATVKRVKSKRELAELSRRIASIRQGVTKVLNSWPELPDTESDDVMRKLTHSAKSFISEYEKESRRVRSSRSNEAKFGNGTQEKRLSDTKLASQALHKRFEHLDNLKW